MIKPPLFGKAVAADNRRKEFDVKNEQILNAGKQPDIVFIGDSITHQWELKAYFDNYIVNRGISGDRTEYLLQRFDGDAIQLNPKKIVVLIGTNDIFDIENDYWNRTEGLDEKEVECKIIDNIDKISEKSNNLALCSILPTDIAQPFNKQAWNDMIVRLNEKINKICYEKGMLYIDYHSHMCTTDGKTLTYELSYDGIHPNAKGYELMANIIRKELNL